MELSLNCLNYQYIPQEPKMRGPTLFKQLRKDFSFAYLSAVCLLFGENLIEINVDKYIILNFANFLHE